MKSPMAETRAVYARVQRGILFAQRGYLQRVLLDDFGLLLQSVVE